MGAAVALVACGGAGSSTSTAMGTLRVGITDVPACGFDHVKVTVLKVRIHQMVVVAPGHVTGVMTGVPVAGQTITTLNSSTSAFSFTATADGTVSGAIASTTIPIVASVDAMQTLTNGDVVDIWSTNPDSDAGLYSLSLPATAPVVAAYSATASSVAFTADALAGVNYSIQATSVGVSKSAQVAEHDAAHGLHDPQTAARRDAVRVRLRRRRELQSRPARLGGLGAPCRIRPDWPSRRSSFADDPPAMSQLAEPASSGLKKRPIRVRKRRRLPVLPAIAVGRSTRANDRLWPCADPNPFREAVPCPALGSILWSA